MQAMAAHISSTLEAQRLSLGSRSCSRWCPPCAPSSSSTPARQQRSWNPAGPSRRLSVARPAVDQDLDWDVPKTPSTAPGRGGSGIPPPPPPPPRGRKPAEWWETPFTSRRNIAFTMLAGSAGLWLLNNKAGPIRFEDKPDVPFKLLGFTDLKEEDFVYFKTAGGNWVAAAEDELGRLFMVDEIGDLYYDSGDPDIGLYAMDTQGNLYNFYMDVGGERKITPVGNIADLRSFKISELAGVKLDRNINVVAFQDGREIPLPPGTGYVDESGRFVPPGELVEGFTRSSENQGGLLQTLLKGGDAADFPPDRFEVDLDDPTPFSRQMYDQILLDDPTLPDYQPALPDDFDPEELAREVQEEAAAKSGRRIGIPRR